MKTFTLSIMLLASLVTVMPAAATLIISSEISLQADANAGSNPVTDTDSDSQGATINPLGPVSVSAVSVNGGATVEALATVSSTWNSASKGQVIFSDVGFISTNVSNGSANTTSGLDWQYIFQATSNGQFEMDFSINTDPRTTDDFGLNGINFFWSGAGGGDFLDLDTAGTITRDIIDGMQYTVGLRNQANISGSLGNRVALMDATIDFRIVPEPATIALFGLGLAGLGFARKKKNSA